MGKLCEGSVSNICYWIKRFLKIGILSGIMNILVISAGYPPLQGGVETQAYLQVNELSNRGHNVIVITRCVDNFPETENINGVQIFRLKEPLIKLNPWRSFFFIKKHLKRIEEIISNNGVDLIHIHQFDWTFPYAWILKRNIDIPIVTTIHVSWFADPQYLKWKCTPIEPIRRLLRLYPGLWFERRSIRDADYLIPVSKGIEKYCKIFKDSENIKVIPNAIDLDQFSLDVIPVDIDCSGFKILCSGRLSPEKGQIFLIEAFKHVNSCLECHLFFMGMERGNEKAKLENRISELNLGPFVHFIPQKPYNEVQRYYRAMDLVVQPSTSESFGIAILENMALGNVVVASNVGGIPDLIDDGISGLLVPPADPEALGKKIIQALLDEQLRKNIQINAIKKAKTYDIKQIVDEIEDIYNRFAN